MPGIVFDLDGTLVDSAPDLHAAANRMLAENGLAPLSLETIISFIGNGVPKLVERCLKHHGAEFKPAHIEQFSAHYSANPFTLTKPYPGVVKCLQNLKNKGFELGICTNKPELPALKILKGLGLDTYFSAIVGGDTLPVLKPDPAPLLACAQKVGGNALYVGDSETDAQTARNAKMTFALYSKGYRKNPVSKIPHDYLFDEFWQLEGFAEKINGT